MQHVCKGVRSTLQHTSTEPANNLVEASLNTEIPSRSFVPPPPQRPRIRLRLIVKPPPTPLADLVYSDCTAKQLRESVKARGGTASRYNTKEQLERKLRRLDKECDFPQFLDLPAELRTIVYRELLHIDEKSGCVGNVSILRISKLMYQETVALLYGINTLKFEVSSINEMYLQDIIMSLDERKARIDSLAIQYTALCKATFHRIQRLDIELDTRSHSSVRQLNRVLAALANVLSGSSSLKTVDVHLLHGIDRFPRGWDDSYELDKILYPLAKLQNTDVGGSSQKRVVRFHGFDHSLRYRGSERNVRESLESRIVAGTPFPVDAMGALTTLRQQGQELEKLMDRYPPVDATLDVFLSALGYAIEENILPDMIDFDSDRLFCRKVNSLKEVFDANRERWSKCISERILADMLSARTDTDDKCGEIAEDWLQVQRATFENLRNGRK